MIAQPLSCGQQHTEAISVIHIWNLSPIKLTPTQLCLPVEKKNVKVKTESRGCILHWVNTSEARQARNSLYPDQR